MTQEFILIGSIISGIAVLLLLIIRFRLNAFLSLMTASIWIALFGGIPPAEIGNVIAKGMGDTLGFVATIVGLGSIFGAILEHTGGAHQLSNFLLKKIGEPKARLAMLLSGFIVAIPVFFDVAFIILFPVIQGISRRTGKPLLTYALPLLAGIAITHSFIPPTPGPVAVADILKVDLGWMILLGALVGLPAALIGGLLVTRFFVYKTSIDLEAFKEAPKENESTDLVFTTHLAILLPLILMVLQAVSKTLVNNQIIEAFAGYELILFIGHPFSALLIATFFAIYVLGKKANLNQSQLSEIAGNALGPAGIIILITGAGGVLKQTLITTGIGSMMAESIASNPEYLLILAYGVSSLVRILQGSATIAMITGAGIIGPVIEILPELTMIDKSLLAIAIAAGSMIASHVNDSGFWLVNRYLKHEVTETLKSWTIVSTLISLISFLIILLISAML